MTSPKFLPIYDYPTGKWYVRDCRRDAILRMNGTYRTVQSFCKGHNTAESLVRDKFIGLSTIMRAIGEVAASRRAARTRRPRR